MGLLGARETPFRRSPHSPETRPIRIDEGDGLGGTCLGAFRLSATQIAFGDLAGFLVVIYGSERACDGAYLAPNALRFDDNLGACVPIHLYGVYRACIHAPSFRALGTSEWREFSFVMEDEDLDTGFRRIEDPFFRQRTGHLALQATGAFLGLDVQETLHGSTPSKRKKFIDVADEYCRSG